jgi:hypothetical protein
MGRIARFKSIDPCTDVVTEIQVPEEDLIECQDCGGTGLAKSFYSDGIWQNFPQKVSMPCPTCQGNGGVIPESNKMNTEPFARKRINTVEFVYPPPSHIYHGPITTLFFRIQDKLIYEDWFSDKPFPKLWGISYILMTEERMNMLSRMSHDRERRPHTFI